MLRLLSIPLALLLLLAVAVIWSGGGAEEPRADFSFISRTDVNTLDIGQMSYLADMRVAYAIWEGLYAMHPETLDPVPGVASSHEVNPEKTVYTFHLRPEARWSNGDPVTAHDFVFAWRRILQSPGEYTYLHYYINNAETYCMRYARREPVDFKTVGLVATDPNTLRVTLANPVTFFLDLMAFPPFFPLHEKSMRSFAHVGQDGRVLYDQQFTRPPSLVTNGPFMLTRWEFKRRLRLEANPHYWDIANVKSRSIDMAIVEDPLTMLRRYEFGKVDWLADIPSEIGSELMGMNRPDMHNFPGFATLFITLNCKPTLAGGRPNPMADFRIRQAMAMTIDKKTITHTILRMGEQPATNYIPPGVFAGYQSKPGLPYDIPAARRLLTDAGFPNGKNFPRLTVIFRADRPAVRDYVQNIVKQWNTNLGIEVALQTLEGKTLRTRVNARDFDIAPGDWTGDYNDPSTFTDKFRSNSENNDSAWINEQYDRLAHAAASESDPAKRFRLLEQAEQILNEQVPVIPLCHLTNSYLFRDNVKGINLNPRNMTIFKGVYVQRNP